VAITERQIRLRWLGLAALVLSGLVVGLDVTILATALPTLSAKLDASTSQLQWISAAYMLSMAGLLLPAGMCGDRFGRRRLLMVGLVVFGGASVAASQVGSADWLIGLRALMGVGAALIVPLTLSVLPSMFADEERPRAVAFSMIGTYLGLPLGPVVAGWLLTNFAWGSIFLINAPVVVLALLGVWLLVPESKDLRAPRPDWLGSVLGLAGITSLTYAIVEQPEHGWTGGDVVVTFVAGLVLMGMFIAWETRSRSPLVDLRIFLKGRFTWSTLAFTTVGFVMSGVLFGLSQYIQIIQGNDAMGTGLRMLPMVAALMLGSLASTRLTAHWGSRVIVAGGLLVTALGMTLLTLPSASSGYGLIAIALTVGGLGIGVAMPAAVDAMMGALPRAQMGVGMGLSSTLRQLGSVLGVAVLGSILSSGYRDGLIGHLTGMPASLQNATEGSLAGAAAVARHLPSAIGGTLQRAAYDAFTGGMSDMMLVCAGVALAGALLIFLFLPARAPAIDAAAPEPGNAHGSAASLEVVGATAAEA